MKVVITGAEGQLGHHLKKALCKKCKVYAFSRKGLDICNFKQAEDMVNDIKPDVIIHAAAVTNIQNAELNPEHTILVNSRSTQNLADISRKYNSKFVFISSAYVFDGKKAYYTEKDIPNPINMYGKSKLWGERMVRDYQPNHFIIRSSWIYGEKFIRYMFDKIMNQDKFCFDEMQIGSPTNVLEFSDFIFQVMQTDAYGTYHVTNQGDCSKYEYFNTIYNEFTNKPIQHEIRRNASMIIPTNCTLDNMEARSRGFHNLLPWKDSLIRFIREMDLGR
ncbi:SDR family oxidoreductase [Fictibacillus phosphorivorans]|uniref:SDR family oxidoreductase n=1 Tax=Fictibacillus phosphorivorans TaxID=1221500 RepID=UPI003CF7DEF3